MPEVQLPAGDYFSVAYVVRPGSGGQTRAMMMRNRLFHQVAGVRSRVLTLDDPPVYPEVREVLRGQGLLVEGVELLNLFEYYRTRPVSDTEPYADALPRLSGLDRVEDPHPDGTLYRTRHVSRKNGKDTVVDYHRPDGSVYLRLPAPATVRRRAAVSPVVLADALGRPVRAWRTKAGLHRRWLHDLSPGPGKAFVVCDSRSAITELAPMKDPRFHVLLVVHNVHVGPPRRWNSPPSRGYTPILDGIADLDGLVTLTTRQREDIAMRCGATDNLFVVPNPVEAWPRSTRAPREAARFAVVSRLEEQKRLDHALRAFAKVVAVLPEARLDVYGDGTHRIALQELAERLGVAGAVVFHGHDVRAREALDTATGFVMTSLFEGYPLATLESMSHGCPVISYDISYGPREQIADGVDGFLVEEGDVDAVAARMLELARDPDLVARMSAAAVDKAARHGPDAFVRDWRAVLEDVVLRKPLRSRLDHVELRVHSLGYLPGPGLSRVPSLQRRLPARLRRPRPSSAGLATTPTMELGAELRVHGRGRRRGLDRAAVVLQAVCDRTARVADLPLDVRREGRTFHLASRFDLGEVFRGLSEDSREVWLRLTFVWGNSGWQAAVSRPEALEPPFEVAYGPGGRLTVRRGLPRAH